MLKRVLLLRHRSEEREREHSIISRVFSEAAIQSTTVAERAEYKILRTQSLLLHEY